MEMGINSAPPERFGYQEVGFGAPPQAWDSFASAQQSWVSSKSPHCTTSTGGSPSQYWTPFTSPRRSSGSHDRDIWRAGPQGLGGSSLLTSQDHLNGATRATIQGNPSASSSPYPLSTVSSPAGGSPGGVWSVTEVMDSAKTSAASFPPTPSDLPSDLDFYADLVDDGVGGSISRLAIASTDTSFSTKVPGVGSPTGTKASYPYSGLSPSESTVLGPVQDADYQAFQAGLILKTGLAGSVPLNDNDVKTSPQNNKTIVTIKGHTTVPDSTPCSTLLALSGLGGDSSLVSNPRGSERVPTASPPMHEALAPYMLAEASFEIEEPSFQADSDGMPATESVGTSFHGVLSPIEYFGGEPGCMDVMSDTEEYFASASGNDDAPSFGKEQTESASGSLDLSVLSTLPTGRPATSYIPRPGEHSCSYEAPPGNANALQLVGLPQADGGAISPPASLIIDDFGFSSIAGTSEDILARIYESPSISAAPIALNGQANSSGEAKRTDETFDEIIYIPPQTRSSVLASTVRESQSQPAIGSELRISKRRESRLNAPRSTPYSSSRSLDDLVLSTLPALDKPSIIPASSSDPTGSTLSGSSRNAPIGSAGSMGNSSIDSIESRLLSREILLSDPHKQDMGYGALTIDGGHSMGPADPTLPPPAPSSVGLARRLIRRVSREPSPHLPSITEVSVHSSTGESVGSSPRCEEDGFKKNSPTNKSIAPAPTTTHQAIWSFIPNTYDGAESGYHTQPRQSPAVYLPSLFAPDAGATKAETPSWWNGAPQGEPNHTKKIAENWYTIPNIAIKDSRQLIPATTNDPELPVFVPQGANESSKPHSRVELEMPFISSTEFGTAKRLQDVMKSMPEVNPAVPIAPRAERPGSSTAYSAPWTPPHVRPELDVAILARHIQADPNRPKSIHSSNLNPGRTGTHPLSHTKQAYPLPAPKLPPLTTTPPQTLHIPFTLQNTNPLLAKYGAWSSTLGRAGPTQHNTTGTRSGVLHSNPPHRSRAYGPLNYAYPQPQTLTTPIASARPNPTNVQFLGPRFSRPLGQ